MPRYVVTVTYEMSVVAADQAEAIEDAEEQLGEMIAEGDDPDLSRVYVHRRADLVGCLGETVDGRPLERCKEYPRCGCAGPDAWEEGMGGDAVLDRNVP